MNFLAHAYLSFNDPGILAGNMISDFVKGKKQYDYPLLIQKGIKLHRSIDTFTDSHPAIKKINRFFSPVYRLYSGAFTDIVLDYFLANDTNEFATDLVLQKFTEQTYNQLQQNMHVFPVAFQQIFPHMRQHDWLYHYKYTQGIIKSFSGMASRAKYISESETAGNIFINNLEQMRPYYLEFFPMLKNHAMFTLKDLLKTD